MGLYEGCVAVASPPVRTRWRTRVVTKEVPVATPAPVVQVTVPPPMVKVHVRTGTAVPTVPGLATVLVEPTPRAAAIAWGASLMWLALGIMVVTVCVKYAAQSRLVAATKYADVLAHGRRR